MATWAGERRTLRTIGLREISVVSAWPAYPDTTLALRARDATLGHDARARRLILAELGALA